MAVERDKQTAASPRDRASEQEVELALRIERERRLLRMAKLAPGRQTLVEDEQQVDRDAPSPVARAHDFRGTAMTDVLVTLGAITRGERSGAVKPGDPVQQAQVARAMPRVAEARAQTLYRRAVDDGAIAAHDPSVPNVPSVDDSLATRGGGQALPDELRRQLERELGVELARVRIHTDATAAEAARAVRAQAFTVGEDIFFAGGMYDPDSAGGRRLLAHELAHVVQHWQGRTQSSSSGSSGDTGGHHEVSKPSDALEHEAEAVADRVAEAVSPSRVAAERVRAERRVARPRARAHDSFAGTPIRPRTLAHGQGQGHGASSPSSLLLRKAEPASEVRPRTLANKRENGQLDDLGRLRETLANLGSGASLPATIASKYSQLLGADLSSVRIHASGAASTAAAGMGARAFTFGSNVAFAPGAYDEVSAAQDHVLAHELVHVVQNQRAGGAAMTLAARLDVGPSASPVEAEAEAGAHALTSGRSFAVSARGSLPAISMHDGKGLPTEPPKTTVPLPDGGTPTPTPKPDGGTPQPVANKPPENLPGGTKGAPGPAGAKGNEGNDSSGGIPGGTPGPTDKTPEPTPTPTTKKAAGSELDAKVATILEQRADPATKAEYSKSLSSITTLRMAALGYSFVNAGVGHTIAQIFWPSDAIGDHAGQIGKLNAYRGNDPDGGTSFMGGVQRAIEGLRGVLHIIGDVAAALSAVAGVVALASAAVAAVCAISVIGLAGPAEVAGGIAIIADSIATVLALIKIAADIIDMILGLLQMIILIFRARAAKGDPAARARFAQLMRKEAGDFAGNVVGVAVQIGALLLTAGAGAGGAKGFAKMAAKDVGNEFKKLIVPKLAYESLKDDAKLGAKLIRAGAADTKAGVRIGLKGSVRAVAGDADKELATLSVLKRNAKGKALTGKGGVKLRKIEEFELHMPKLPNGNIARGTFKVLNTSKLKYIVIKEAGANTAVGSTTQVFIDTKAPASGGNGAAPEGGIQRTPGTPAAGSLSHVQMWPSQIEMYKTELNLLDNAKEHVEEQLENAKAQAGPELAAAWDAKLKAAIEKRNATKETADGVKGDADEGKGHSGDAADKAKQGDDAKKKGDANNKAMSDKTSGIDDKAGTLKTPPPKDGIGSWLWNHSVGYLGEALGWVTSGIKNSLGKFMFYLAGYDSAELDFAGIEGDMRTAAQSDTMASQTANATSAAVDPVQSAVVDMQKDKTTNEQQAIQGMADARNLLEALETAQKSLEAAIEGGEAYMAAAAPILEHESETETEGKKIDGAYIKQAEDYADAIASELDNQDEGPSIASQATAIFAGVKAQLPELDIGPATGAIAKEASAYATGHKSLVDQAHAGAAKAKAALAAFVGTTDYNGVNENAAALDKLADDLIAANDKLGDKMVADINAVIKDYNDQINAALAQPDPQNGTDAPADGTPVSRKGGGQVTDGAEAAVQAAASSGGAPLPAGVRREIEASSGADLSSVRVHTGAASNAAAGAVGARAYAVGQDIHFADGQYDPNSASGKQLIAHEVAHTIQQKGGTAKRQNKLAVSEAGDHAEVEADRFADAVAGGRAATLSSGSTMISRDPTPDRNDPEKPPPEYAGMDAGIRKLLANSRDTLDGFVGKTEPFWDLVDTQLNARQLQALTQTIHGANAAGVHVTKLALVYNHDSSWGIHFKDMVGAPAGWGKDYDPTKPKDPQGRVRAEHEDTSHVWYRQPSGPGNPGMHIGVATAGDFTNLHWDPSNPMDHVSEGAGPGTNNPLLAMMPNPFAKTVPVEDALIPKGCAVYNPKALLTHADDIGWIDKKAPWLKRWVPKHAAVEGPNSSTQPFFALSEALKPADFARKLANEELKRTAQMVNQPRGLGVSNHIIAAADHLVALEKSSRPLALEERTPANESSRTALAADVATGLRDLYEALVGFFHHLHQEVGSSSTKWETIDEWLALQGNVYYGQNEMWAVHAEREKQKKAGATGTP